MSSAKRNIQFDLAKFFDLLVKAALTAGVVILFVLHLDSKPNIAFVDTAKLITAYKGTKVATDELESKAKVWRSNLDTLRRELEQVAAEYQKQRGKLSERERKLMEEVVRSKEETYLRYEQSVKENVQKSDQEMTKQVLERVNGYISKYGKERGYKMIFAATQYGNIVYAEDVFDVTEEVIKGINTEFDRR